MRVDLLVLGFCRCLDNTQSSSKLAIQQVKESKDKGQTFIFSVFWRVASFYHPILKGHGGVSGCLPGRNFSPPGLEGGGGFFGFIGPTLRKPEHLRDNLGNLFKNLVELGQRVLYQYDHFCQYWACKLWTLLSCFVLVRGFSDEGLPALQKGITLHSQLS